MRVHVFNHPVGSFVFSLCGGGGLAGTSPDMAAYLNCY